ncbi:MAG: L,D-transpeptidase [Xanthobacteraceae bacterium]
MQQRRATVARRARLRQARWLSIAGAAFLAGQSVPASASMYWDNGFGAVVGIPPYDGGSLIRRHPVVHKKHVTESDKPDSKANELAAKAGHAQLQAIISIHDQKLTLYADGNPIARSQVATGVPDHPTPTGIFSVIQKQRYHTSNIYSGAPMPFMQRITWSGVALHLGVVPGHPASHGCIRLPDAFAQQLWVTTRLGARVIIARDELAPIPFEHERLFAFRQPVPPPVTPTPAAQPDAPAPAEKPDTRAPEGAPAAATPSGESSENQVTPDSQISPDNSERPKTNPVQLAAAELSTKPGTTGASLPVLALSKPSVLKPGPIAVFISRKEGKLFVRKGFEPLFEVPVTIDRPTQPLGTHLYTALGFKEDGTNLRWNLVTMPTSPVAERRSEPTGGSRKAGRRDREVSAVQPPPASTAAEALERITIPETALQRISELISPGASLIISDYGLGGETGEYTDFIVVTR